MRVVGLVSGGKDSCYSMMQCVAAGHSLVALANLQPEVDGEIDSYMYQSVGHEGVAVLAEAMGLPLFRHQTRGRAKQTGKFYRPEEGDEVEDLHHLLATVQMEVGIDAVSVGAILSDYQRTRVENVCARLGLKAFAFLWQRDQVELLNEMVCSGVQAILVKVAALGLDPSLHLGRDISDMTPHLLRMKEKWGLNVCGEGGEYETFTLDCPLFNKAIVVDDYETVIHDDNAIAPVGYLSFKKMHLINKAHSVTCMPLSERLESHGVRGPQDFLNGSDEFHDGGIGAEEDEDENKEGIDHSPLPPLVSEEQLCNQAQLCSGPTGWCWITGLAGEGTNCADAMANALSRLRELLENQHLNISDVVSISLWVRDLRQFAALNTVFSACLSMAWDPPVRACVEVALPESWPVLLEATIHHAPGRLPDSGEDNNCSKQSLHVQSMSHWAPASIGPYSQAVKVGSVVHVAGQIALEPSSGQLLSGASVGAECLLALRHVSRILAAIDSRLELQDVVQGVCYLTNPKAVQIVRQLWETRTTNAIVDFVIVPALPRGAQLEWSVWAHAHNRRFEYEETGRRLAEEGSSDGSPTPRASIRSRWSYDGSVAAVVCYIEGPQCSETLSRAVDYTLSKLLREATPNSALTLRAFYRTGSLSVSELSSALSASRNEQAGQGVKVGFSLIPVCALHDDNTLLSLCGLRY